MKPSDGPRWSLKYVVSSTTEQWFLGVICIYVILRDGICIVFYQVSHSYSNIQWGEPNPAAKLSALLNQRFIVDMMYMEHRVLLQEFLHPQASRDSGKTV